MSGRRSSWRGTRRGMRLEAQEARAARGVVAAPLVVGFAVVVLVVAGVIVGHWLGVQAVR